MNRVGFRIKPTTQLTKAQQDAWNAHEAARRGNAASAYSRSSIKSTSQSPDAARLFGGVDSLVEDNQDWWLKDQNSLALGFENWTDMDWTTLENNLNSLGPANEQSTKQHSFPDVVDCDNGPGTAFYGLDAGSGGLGGYVQVSPKKEHSSGKGLLQQNQRLSQGQGKRPLMSFDEDMFY